MEVMSRANFLYWVQMKRKAEKGDKKAQEKIDTWSMDYFLMGLPTIEEQIEQAMPTHQKLYDYIISKEDENQNIKK